MRVVLDIEANGLEPTEIHCVVTKDLDNDDVQVFTGKRLQEEFPVWIKQSTLIVGHNVLEYDVYHLNRLLGCNIDLGVCYDTLVVGRLLDSGRDDGHSLDSYGKLLNHPKTENTQWDVLTDEMIEYCKNDVELNTKLYRYLERIIARNGKAFRQALALEHRIQILCLEMSRNGYKFDLDGLEALDRELANDISKLDEKIKGSFPDKVEYIQLKTKVKEVITPFSPRSPKQIVERLWSAGWKHIDRTKTHNDLLKKKKKTDEDKERLKKFAISGWKVNETNLSTLPEDAPVGCQYLIEHILLSARRRTLAEWRAAYDPRDGSIHGRYNALGTITQRCVHSNPNMGNIATKKTIKYNSPRLRDLATDLGGRMRSFWVAPDNGWLVGTDMESAHLRIFAHLIDDKEFTQSLINGDKKLGTDPHSVNKRRLGDLCVDRDRAKTFIFSFLNGAGAGKVSEIFNCSLQEAAEVLDGYVKAYPGLEKLKQETIPRDAARGYFVGIDGRLVKADSEHKMIGMYLQNMESVLMKYAWVKWDKELTKLGLPFHTVNFVHDEWVTEVEGDAEIAKVVGQVQVDALKWVGEEFNLRCPVSGESKIGKNWLDVH